MHLSRFSLYMTILNSIQKNLCLIGPPGSGKGSYGKHFAQALKIPIFSSSDFLRNCKSNNIINLSSGKLVDDKTVSETILSGLQDYYRSKREHETNDRGYLLDGFPRTLQQLHIMEDTWPLQLHIQLSIKLAVPDIVCETKLLGRRICTICGENYNVNAVYWNGWDLPPYLPTEPCNLTKNHFICDPNQNWITRPDDTQVVVKHRLEVYHQNMDPILEYFERQNRLLKLIPYHGFQDLPILIETVQQWLQSHEKVTK